MVDLNPSDVSLLHFVLTGEVAKLRVRVRQSSEPEDLIFWEMELVRHQDLLSKIAASV